MELAATEVDMIARQLERASVYWAEGDNFVLATGLTYGAARPVEVTVRKRGWRHDISDGGRAEALLDHE